MAGKRQVVINISEIGDVSIDGQGFVGPECEKYTRMFQDALSADKDADKATKKAEYLLNPGQQKVGTTKW